MNLHYTLLSDEDLFTSIAGSNDEAAFAELYDRHFRSLYNYTYGKVNDRFVVQEIIQELFVTLWQQRHRTTLQSCRAYLFSGAKNLVISHFRKEFTRQYHYSQWERQRNPAVESTDQPLLASDLQNGYERGLDQLPPKCREVFLLSRNGQSNREIAQQLAISEKTVEQHMTKALRVLKGYLKEHFVHGLALIALLKLFFRTH